MNAIDSFRAQLKSLPADALGYEVYDFLISKYFDGKQLNEKQLRMLAVFILQFEVSNGGFDQFYSNNQDKFIDSAIEGLKEIEADDFHQLTERSREIYFRDKGLFEDQRNPAFGGLDELFFELKSYSGLQIEFIRSHLEDLITN